MIELLTAVATAAIVGIVAFIIVRFIVLKPLSSVVEYIRTIRLGHADELKERRFSLYRPLIGEIRKMTQSLAEARRAAREEARLRIQHLDAPWTAERLKEFIKLNIKNRPLFVVSNREPYMHVREGQQIRCVVPPSGMVTALEPMMDACGGTWIATALGNADRETSDKRGHIAVPPDEPRYTLKRIWLSPDEYDGFYTGFSNDALWPLCHAAHIRPNFRQEDWDMYRRVNGLYAKSVLEEIKDVREPIVLVQDFHFALLPMMIKKKRPDALIGIFWHIPWPSAESFSICPWRKELLEGMLGADIIGFHTQQHCNNFMDTVGKEIEALIDFEHFSITRDAHMSEIRPFPISIAFTGSDVSTGNFDALYEALGVRTEFIGLGVDRLDYTKGIPERFAGIELFFEQHPEYLGRLTFVQIAPISRGEVAAYRSYDDLVTKEAARINSRFGRDQWHPIVLEKRPYTHRELRELYRRADFCLVTSLHDGMNLVAKEYVAARDDEHGTLILSQFTGAARTMKHALIVNPYHAEEVATAIHLALQQGPVESKRRMKALRETLREYNVYRWSADFLKAVIRSH